MAYLAALALIIGGVLAITRSYQAVRLFGHMGWAERRLGVGGSYTAWKLGGILAIFAGIVLLRYPGLL